MNNKSYRHGDLGLIEISELPTGLKKSDSKILMNGSGGHNHTFDHGDFYPHNDGLVIGFFASNNRTRLYHLEHGNICTVCGYTKLRNVMTECPKCKTNFIRDGKLRAAKPREGLYELRRQQEDTHDGMKPVVD